MKKAIDWIERTLIAIAFVFVMFGGIGLTNFNAFAKRKIRIHASNLVFEGDSCKYQCCEKGGDCEIWIEFEIPDANNDHK